MSWIYSRVERLDALVARSRRQALDLRSEAIDAAVGSEARRTLLVRQHLVERRVARLCRAAHRARRDAKVLS